MVRAYAIWDINYVLALMDIDPSRWTEPSLFPNKDKWYVPVETIERLLEESKLNGDTRKEISDLLAEIEPADVSPTIKPKMQKPQKPINPPKNNEISRLVKPYFETCKYDPNLNEDAIIKNFRRRQYLSPHPGSIQVVVDSLNAVAGQGGHMRMEEVSKHVLERYRNEKLPKLLLKSGYFTLTKDGEIHVKPGYMKG